MKAFYSTILATLFAILAPVSAHDEIRRSDFYNRIPGHAITVGSGGKYPNLTVALNDTSRYVTVSLSDIT